MTQTQGRAVVAPAGAVEDFPPANDALTELMRARIESSISVKQALAADLDASGRVALALVEAFRRGNALLLFGNGGSAADAQHIAAEFVGRFYLQRRALPALALTVNTSALTALGNDFGFDEVFARQVEALGRPGDVAVGLSTSGRSENVLRGLRAANAGGLISVGLTGSNPDRIGAEASLCVPVPSTDTPRIQESHILLGHIWSEVVEVALFGDPAW